MITQNKSLGSHPPFKYIHVLGQNIGLEKNVNSSLILHF